LLLASIGLNAAVVYSALIFLSYSIYLTFDITIMNTRIFSFVIALLMVVGFNNAFAQKANPHINSSDEDKVYITGDYVTDAAGNTSYTLCVEYCLVKGIGNATSVTAYLVTEGTADTECRNGGNDAGPIPGQSFKTTSPSRTFDVTTNGQVEITHLCVTINAGCKTKGGKDWTSTVANVDITSLILMINGKPVDLSDYSITAI
jgi:hypothetical protein